MLAPMGESRGRLCQRLIDKVGLNGKTFIADDWEGFHRLIPEDQLFTGKDLSPACPTDQSLPRRRP
jgi:insertion element IS1 protein InsB